jgi:hypothetical protein
MPGIIPSFILSTATQLVRNRRQYKRPYQKEKAKPIIILPFIIVPFELTISISFCWRFCSCEYKEIHKEMPFFDYSLYKALSCLLLDSWNTFLSNMVYAPAMD